MEAFCSVEYEQIVFNFSCTVNPGTDNLQEMIIWVRSKQTGKLSKITINKAIHPHDSIGVFLEHSDGTVQKITVGDPKTSYAY